MKDRDVNETSHEASREPKPWVETTTLSAGVLIVLAIFAMVNYFAMRHYKRFDATGSKLYTLSEKTEKILRDLDRDIDLVVLLDPASELYTAADELLDRYVAVNPARLERRDLDAARDLLEMQQLIDRYGIERDNVIIVASEDDKRVIGEFDLATYDYSGAQMGQPPAIGEFKGEQEITSAILSLVEAEKPRIVFTTGHGEGTLEPGDGRSLSQARDLLGKDNFEIEEWSSLGSDAVPAETDLLVIAGPTTNFLEPELQLFSDYLASGGRLLLFLDPVFNADGTALVNLGLEDWLASYGVEVRQDLVIDPSSDLPFFGAETLFTDTYGSHPIVESLEQTRTRVLLPLVRSVAASDAADESVTADVTELVLTSEAGWAETDLVNLDQVAPNEGVDRLGPVPIAVAATIERAPSSDGGDSTGEAPVEAAADTDGESRLVVFGDLDFATDAQIGNGANGLLLLNAFNWLVEREQLIEIEARKPEKTRLTMAGGELTSLYLIVLLMMPGAAVITGVWIAMQRRR